MWGIQYRIYEYISNRTQSNRIEILSQVFFEGGCVWVTGLSENPGTQLKCVFYSKCFLFFLIKIFQAQMGYKIYINIFSEGF